jgi:acyl carrier protein
MDPIESTIRNILINDYDCDPDTLQLSDTLVADLGMDSIELVEFGLALEESFDVEVLDDAITQTMTVGEVVNKIKELKG